MIKIKKDSFKELYDSACSPWKSKFDELFKEFVFTDYIEIKKSFVEEMRQACTSDQLPIFNKIFKEHLPENLFEGITDYKSFCKKSGFKAWSLKDFSDHINPKKSFAQEIINQFEFYFNGDWKADWNNENQAKFYPWFKTNLGSGSLTFYDVDFDYYLFNAGAGYFKDYATAEFIGKTFPDVYKDLIY